MLRRSSCAPELVAQLAVPALFVDFLREPTFDAETGEPLDAHPSFYEAVPGGLPDIRCVSAEACEVPNASDALLCSRNSSCVGAA